MRNFATAISTTVLLLVTAIPLLSSCQQTNSSLLLEVSPETISPGEAVSVRLSFILEPNSTTSVVVRFIPPQESVMQHQLDFVADPLGFASGIIEYPKDIRSASTQQIGNYTVLVQDRKTGTLLERDSFKVVESNDFPNFMSEIPAEILFPVIAGGIGGFLTYWYNRLSAKRETTVTLNQKKAETFLILRPTYAHISRSALIVADLTDKRTKAKLVWRIKQELRKQHLPAYSTERLTAQLKNLKGELKLPEEKDDFGKEEIEGDYQRCFYYLTIYARERYALTEKFGAYFLNDPRGERLIVEVEANITDTLRQIFGVVGLDQLLHITSDAQTLTDLKDKLGISYSTGTAYKLYEKFRNWIENSPKEEVDDESGKFCSKEEVVQFIRDLRLFSHIMTYERLKMFREWYSRKEGVNQRLDELRTKIVPDLRSDTDTRYRSFSLDFLFDP